ncbi:MAG TPA: DUF4097 family beta strand repeat-containing protein [Gemmatimonadales bacterium]
MYRDRAVRSAVTAVTLLVLGAGTLHAQRYDTTLTPHGQPRLSINNLSGDIVIRSWSRPQIRVEAEYDRAQVDVSESGGRVAIRTLNRRGDQEVDYTITVPHGTGVEINSISSDVRMSDVCGDLNLTTTSGDIEVSCIEGDAQIQTVSGDIQVSNVKTRHLDVQSTSGDVQVENVKGGVGANSVSGDVNLSGIDGDEVTAETVSGDINYDGRIADNGRYRFSAHSGDVTLRVPSTLNATLSVETFNGEFESDFQVRLNGGRGVGKNWEGQVGSGSARIQLSSFSGTIALRRGAGNSREE